MTQVMKRWHIYVVDLEPRAGSKPGKQRPCLVIQPDEFAEGGLQSVVVLPLTTRVDKTAAFPLRVRIRKGLCDLDKDSDVMVDQILAWDISLIKQELGRLPDALIERVKEALREFLEL